MSGEDTSECSEKPLTVLECVGTLDRPNRTVNDRVPSKMQIAHAGSRVGVASALWPHRPAPNQSISIYISFSVTTVRFQSDSDLGQFQRLEHVSCGFPEHSIVHSSLETRLNHSQTPNVEFLIDTVVETLWRGRVGLDRRDVADAARLPPTTVAICISLSPYNSAVSSPIWTLESSNNSHGPWLSRTLSIVLARHRLNQH